jgi:predicted Zn-dependent protease
VVRGLPLAAEYAARQTPAKVEAEIGAQALAELEGKTCTPSKLPLLLQGALQREFARLTADLGDGRAYRLLMRSCAGLGANALGLPGGTILATDELVAQGRNMQEIAAILAHEVGHVRQRHGLRNALRNAGAIALARALAQDAGAIDGLGAELPAMLLSGGYAPALEDEADAYALQRLRQLGISSRAYADILDRLATRRAAPGATQVPNAPRDYFAAHPLESRIVRALAAETEVDRCTYSASVAFERLEACTRAIDQGKGSGAELAAAHAMRGQLLNARNTQERAIEDLGRALSLGSRDPQAYNALAWILATSPEDRLRDGARAKQLALVACELSGWKDAAIIDTLAAAHAERAEFDEAVRRQKEALGFAEFDQRQGGPARERLALYEAGKPYREVPR